MNSYINNRKKKIIKFIFKKLKNNQNILSATFVGSFIDKKNLNKINDIDLIIIVKKLNKNIFKDLKKKLYKFNPEKFIKKKKSLYINDTFGPLKFNTDNQLVLHLMIYDVDGHINHTINSPFTVFDWERSKIFLNNKISDIYPAGNIQLLDFLYARRGTTNYINDLIKKKISYRKYKFFKKNYRTIKKKIKLLDRDKFEFYFHIIKNLLLNYFKFIEQKNKLFYFKKNDKKISKYFGKTFFKKHIKKINYLIYVKKKLNFNLIKNQDVWMLNFIKHYQNHIIRKLKNSKELIFIRHARTKSNDGSFLGQQRDPHILKNFKVIKKFVFSKVYTSPLKRCIQTLEILANSKNYFTDKNLLEINYGKAEGLKIDQLSKKFPIIIKKWKEGKDPSFPKGESYGDVNNRKNRFLKKIIKGKIKNICIISHNVFLRCLIGESFNIPKRKWYEIFIPHLMPLEFRVIENKIYPNIKRSQLKIIFSNFK